MTYAISAFFILLASAILALGWRAWQNHLEIERLRKNGWRKLTFRPPSNRGHVDHCFLRGLAEFFFLLLMLGAVLGWLFYTDPQ